MVSHIFLLFFAQTLAGFAIGTATGKKSFTLLLLAYSVALSIGGASTLYANPDIGFGVVPNLFGSDGEGYFHEAWLLAQYGILDFQDLIRSNYVGYQIYLASWFVVFGPHLGVGLFANSLLLMLSCAALFRATTILSSSSRAALLACATMMLTTSQVYYSIILLKEPALGFAFSLFVLALAETRSRSHTILRPLVWFAVGAGILVTMRASLLPFVGILLFSQSMLLARGRPHVLAAMAGVFVLLIPVAASFTSYTLDAAYFSGQVLENTAISGLLASGEVDTQGVVGQLGGRYLALPLVLRIGMFAVPTAIQFLLPFNFWSTGFIHESFVLFFSSNLNLIWFLFVGVWALYSIRHWRRIPDSMMRNFLLMGAFFYIFIAVIYGGAIPRYASPSLFLIYPAIGYWWDRYLSEPAEKRKVRLFFGRYYAIGFLFAAIYLVFVAVGSL